MNSNVPSFDPVCYSVNTTALGDAIVSVPVVKYAIDTYHKDTDYRVVASKHFRCLFPFVPDNKFLVIEDTTWKFDKKYAIRRLNDVASSPTKTHVCRLTPARMKLSYYASIGLVGKILNPEHYCYVPIPEIDVSKFGIDFTKTVIMQVSYRDLNRSIPNEELVKIAKYIDSIGLIPIYVGRTSDGAWKERPPVSPFIPPLNCGVDLRNQTSINELATIMSKSIAVLGVDSGVLHLAGTTETAIIASYTNVDWKYRIPIRKKGITIVVEPDESCRYCSSHWLKDFYNFLYCYYGHNNCTKSLKAELYIKALDKIIEEFPCPRATSPDSLQPN